MVGQPGEPHGPRVHVRTEAQVVQELAEGAAGLSMADVRITRGRVVDPREEVHRVEPRAVAGPRHERAAPVEEGQRDGDDQGDERSHHHGLEGLEHDVGRTSRGDDGRRLGVARWRRALDDEEEAEQAQRPHHQPSHDSECSHESPLCLGPRGVAWWHKYTTVKSTSQYHNRHSSFNRYKMVE